MPYPSAFDAEPYVALGQGKTASAWAPMRSWTSWLLPFGCGVAATVAAFALSNTGVTESAAMSSERSSERSLALDCARAVEPVLERNLASSPFAFAIDGVTPRELQLARGTCWIFAAVAVLEHSYRQQGIARGWLKPNQYLRLSEQAFGIAVLDLCTQYNATCGQMVGHEIWSGGQMIPLDTEGRHRSDVDAVWKARLSSEIALSIPIESSYPALTSRLPNACARVSCKL
eukprot:2979806-Pleurochrysis_carterae.AAC.2